MGWVVDDDDDDDDRGTIDVKGGPRRAGRAVSFLRVDLNENFCLGATEDLSCWSLSERALMPSEYVRRS